jgi:hypothetical protein
MKGKLETQKEAFWLLLVHRIQLWKSRSRNKVLTKAPSKIQDQFLGKDDGSSVLLRKERKRKEKTEH